MHTFLKSNFVKRNHPLLAVAVGSGRVTRATVDAGVDWLLALSAGVYRNQGAGSLGSFLASGNANEQVLELLRVHCLPQRKNKPVFAGVLANDPTTSLSQIFENLRSLGVEGITNWPTIGFIDGQLREALEENGWDIASEATMLKSAREAGFATLGFALHEKEVEAFRNAGVDGFILNLGLTKTIPDIPERRDRLQSAAVLLRRLLAVAHAEAGERRPICLAFGGPILNPEDLEVLFKMTEIDGFAGGSLFERLPVEETVTATVRGFKAVMRHSLSGSEASASTGLGELLGRSQPMRDVFRLIQRVGPSEFNVCLTGETGTGKELAATLLHRLSPRAAGPFVTVNCGAITDSLLESELFGHEKGAFTGAHRRRLGKFELAHNGTLFLDEIGDLSPHGQVALLRAIQQREITRVGSETIQPVNIRIITATHLNLEKKVEEGSFRADLFYRLNEFTITLPPLRERLDDLPILVNAFLKHLEARLGRHLIGLTADFHHRLKAHGWPGNLRELQHVLAQAVLLEDGAVLTGTTFRSTPWNSSNHYPTPSSQAKINPLPLEPAKRSANARTALLNAKGNKAQAARALGITRKTLYAWLKEASSLSEG